MAQVISTKATEIIKKYFPYYEEEFTNEYKLKLHACLFEYADYIANERLKNISSNTMLAAEVCERETEQAKITFNPFVSGMLPLSDAKIKSLAKNKYQFRRGKHNIANYREVFIDAIKYYQSRYLSGNFR